MIDNGMRLSAALLAALPAGPVFLTSWFVADLYLRLPAAVTVDPLEIAEFVATLIPAVFLGIILAIVPLLFGMLFMSACAVRWESARSGPAWVAAGLAAGGGLALWFDATGASAFAVVVTSALCASLARRGIEL